MTSPNPNPRSNVTSEELATILREELPTYSVAPLGTSHGGVTAVAHCGEWVISVHTDGLGTSVRCSIPQPENYKGAPNAHVPSVYTGPGAGPREAVRKMITRARAWVAALQAGCP